MNLKSYWDLKKQHVYMPSGDFVYKVCPALNEEQQYIVEYTLPIVLPALMHVTNMSSLGMLLGMIIFCGHALQTMITDFGPRTDRCRLKAWISPLLHHTLDCIWLQLLVSIMLLMPECFDACSNRSSSSTCTLNPRSAFYLALTLIQTLPIYLSVSYKSHFINYYYNKCAIIEDNKKIVIEQKIPSPLLEIMGNHICTCFVWYWIGTVWLGLSYMFETHVLLWIGVGAFNMIAILLTKRYRREVQGCV